jgi:hypothetical protein
MNEPTIQKPNVWKKRFTILISLMLLWFVWKADVFWNYYQFKQLCAAEGGLKVYKKLERGRGWEQAKYSSFQGAQSISRYPGVGFVRHKRTEHDPLPELGLNSPIDITYLGGPYDVLVSYKVVPADLSREITYRKSSRLIDPMPEQSRTNLISLELEDAKTLRLLVAHNQFQFRWRTIPIWHWFGPSGTTGCPISEQSAGQNIQLFDQSILKD